MDVKEDDSVCIVCWRDIHVYAIGLCDHPVCHECSTRMRVLCRKSECPICRRTLPKVIFVKECRPYEELNKRLYQVDVRPQICFEDESVRQAYRELLDNRCKYCPPSSTKPPTVFSSFAQLRNHVRKEHNRTYCDLCVEHLKIFPGERTAYNRRDMARHQSHGDLDDTSHKGHPLCKFCDVRYFDNDELYRHLRRDHYYCHFCGDDYRLQYYRNYEYLRAHFREEHFLCEEGDCRNETFTAAFRTEIDLKAHRAQQHNRSLTKAQAKQARTLDLEFAVTPRASANALTVVSSSYYDEFGGHGRRPPRQPRLGRGPPPDTSRENLLAAQSRSQTAEDLQMTWELQPPVDYRCEKEFPQLGSDGGAPAPSTSSGNKAPIDPFPVAASSYPPRRPNKVNVNSVDEFPSLNPSSSAATQQGSAAPPTPAMVSLRKSTKAHGKGHANGIAPGQRSAAKQQQDANNNGPGGKTAVDWFAQPSGDRSSVKPQLSTVSAVVSARPAPELARSEKAALQGTTEDGAGRRLSDTCDAQCRPDFNFIFANASASVRATLEHGKVCQNEEKEKDGGGKADRVIKTPARDRNQQQRHCQDIDDGRKQTTFGDEYRIEAIRCASNEQPAPTHCSCEERDHYAGTSRASHRGGLRRRQFGLG
ncbi:hypothetical protein MTO96_051748 [Rhipicephalus appendiculatus]